MKNGGGWGTGEGGGENRRIVLEKIACDGTTKNEMPRTLQLYNLYGQNIQNTEEEKDVGVILTPDLRPSKMVARAASRANQVLGAWSRAVSWRDKSTWIKIYKTYVRPKLEYCSQAWSPWTLCDRETLEKVQRRAVGMVTTLPRDMEYNEKLKILGLTYLVEQRE